MSELPTLDTTLRRRAEAHPDRIAFTELDPRTAERTLTYGSLERRVQRVAALLSELGAERTPVVLAHPTGADFAVAFLACLRAQAYAVPTPQPVGVPEVQRLESIVRDTGAAVALTAGDADWRGTPIGLNVVRTDEEGRLPDAAPPRRRDPRGGDVAMVQYTSGSTSTPRGVVISHDNLAHNQRLIERAFGHGPHTVIVSWLPAFHDMGLACLLQGLHVGGRSALMSPAAFLSRPARWLEAVSRFRATTSGGPDFAYALCRRSVSEEQAVALDLRSWRAAFNGSEPIRASTMREFAAAFQDAGFDKRSFVCCYGLAEATLLVSAGRPGNRVAMRDGHVSTGAPVGQQVAIVGPDGAERAPGETGEIWVSGPSVATGYWNRPEESGRTLHSRLRGRGERRFLRTGDLGFMADGELYVTGRLKDLIIVRGANHHPHDIERTVERCDRALRRGRGAAFSVPGTSGEAVVLVFEVRQPDRDWAALAAAIRRSVTRGHGLDVDAVVLVVPDSVPRTTSGKVRRQACRAAYLEGRLDAVYRWRRPESKPSGDLTATGGLADWMRAWLAQATGAADLDAPATSRLDSLGAMTLARALGDRWGVPVSAADVLGCTTLGDLAERLQGAAEGPVRPPAIGAPASSCTSLSSTQRGIWFLHELDPEGGAWTITRAFRIHGACDPQALQRAFRALVERHATLRSRIGVVEGAPVQTACDVTDEPLRLHPGRAPPTDGSGCELELARGPLLRADLYLGDSVLVVRVHHLAADLWSFGRIVDDLDRLLSGDESAHVDAVVEHGPVERDGAAAYWARALDGALVSIDLPARTRNPGPAGQAAAHQFEISPRVHGELTALARAEDATPYMVYLAAVHVLLHRLTGQDDLVVGSPVSIRDRLDDGDRVGCFISPVAMRADASGDPPFTDFLARVRAATLGALDHADYPLDLLAPTLGSRAGASPGLFDVVVLWHGSPQARAELAAIALERAGTTTTVGGCTWELLEPARHAARFDLELAFAAVGPALAGSLVYDESRFAAGSVADIVVQLQTLLACIADDPTRRLSELAVGSPEQTARIAGWRGTHGAARPARLLHEQFARCAAADPTAPAIAWEGTTTTYAELRSAGLASAAALQQSGVAERGNVALMMDDSPAAIAAMLGALEAGHAFACPSMRAPGRWVADVLTELAPVALIVDDVGSEVLRQAAAAGFEPTGPVLSCAPDYGAAPATADTDPDCPAFVAYTSGSTGRPKGVVQSHGSFARFLEWQSRRFEIRPGTRVAHWSALSYDAGYCEIFGALCFGATLCMAPPGTRYDPAAFAELIDAAGIALLQVTPSYLRQLLAAVRGRALPSLERVMVAGEVLTPELVADWQDLYPGIPLLNLYGPTETVLATCHPVTRDDASSGPVPLGRPIDGTCIELLDSRRRPVPIGAVGEVFVASQHLADGYLADPARTAAAFVPATSGPAGARMYATGDLASWSSEGLLRFHGRRDGQMKVRGMRVEAGEVESALQRHPDVIECAVVGRSDGVSGVRMEAHVVAARPVSAATLRSHLAAMLPPHMIPARLGFDAALPRTLTGKVARSALRALPPPAARRLRSPPRSADQQLVAALWTQLLAVEGPDLDDDFFALGGNSLTAMQLANRVAAIWSVDFSVGTVFATPTLRGQSEAIARADGDAPDGWGVLLDELERLSEAEVLAALGTPPR